MSVEVWAESSWTSSLVLVSVVVAMVPSGSPTPGATKLCAYEMARRNLDHWIADPAVRVRHSRTADAAPDALWRAAEDVRLSDTRLLRRVVRWRLPGVSA